MDLSIGTPVDPTPQNIREALAATLLLPAAIEIRSNLHKGKATALQKKLAEAGVAAETVPEAPAAGVPRA